MSCILWSDDIGSGCIEFDGTEKVIGRSCLSESPRWLPRNIFEVFQIKGFWLIRLITNHDWIIVEYHDETAWTPIKADPVAIDENTMIRVRMAKSSYLFKFVFMGAIACKDVTAIDYIWRSNVWNSPTQMPTESKPSEVLSESDQAVASRLEWLAVYFEKHRWSAIASLLTLGAIAVGIHYLPDLPNRSVPPAIQQK